jgi:hypothetical protein
MSRSFPSKSPGFSLRIKHALAAVALFGLASMVGCASSPAMNEPAAPPEKHAGDAAAPGQQQYPQQAGASPQFPNVSSTRSLADEEAAFELFEKQAGFAIEGKSQLGEPLSAGTDRCVNVCKALASMRASAEHICQLDSGRCTSVKERVERTEKRAKDACPSCSNTPT